MKEEVPKPVSAEEVLKRLEEFEGQMNMSAELVDPLYLSGCIDTVAYLRGKKTKMTGGETNL